MPVLVGGGEKNSGCRLRRRQDVELRSRARYWDPEKENPDGVRKGVPVNEKAAEKRLRSFRKGRRVIKKTTRRFEHFHCCSTTRVSRGFGRFYWCKDNENILNGKEILKFRQRCCLFQISSLSQSDGKPIAAVFILGCQQGFQLIPEVVIRRYGIKGNNVSCRYGITSRACLSGKSQSNRILSCVVPW